MAPPHAGTDPAGAHPAAPVRSGACAAVRASARLGAAGAALAAVLTGCAAVPAGPDVATLGTVAASPRASTAASPAASTAASPAASTTAAPTLVAAAARRVTTGMLDVAAPVTMTLSIPSIGIENLPVVPYTGWPDDLLGTRIEDAGVAASPRGARGGVGPGAVGNLIITGHRTAAGGPLRRLPSLRDGAHVLVRSGHLVYDYEVTGTLTVSFRSRASQDLQSAAVPGQPGQLPSLAMITVSTCATPEDHARGDYWTDALGNPEHRIDKIGVLVAVRAA